MSLSPEAQFIIGPQVPIGDNYFDQTFVAKARQHGQACPAVPPADPDAVTIQGTTFNNHFYYDLPQVEYTAHARTDDPTSLAIARKAADLWWLHPQWIKGGEERLFPDQATPAPRHAGIGGLILRAIDGRPEMWDWINAYTRASFDIWIKWRINNPQLHFGLREGAFVLQFAAWLAKALPDSFPNAAAIRAQYVADIESACVNYFGRLQQADGSWRWDTSVDEYGDSKLTLALAVPSGSSAVSITTALVEAIPQNELIYFPNQDVLLKVIEAVPAGRNVIPIAQAAPNAQWLPLQRSLPQGAQGQYAPLRGIMQPFMVGLMTSALIDAHEVVQSPTVRERIKSQVLRACRHLYSDGPYIKDEIEQRSGKRIRGFHYFYHGGTSVNPAKYAKGDMQFPWTDLEGWWLASARQPISTILPAYGWAYKVSGDEFYKLAGEELWDAAYSGRDGFRAMMDDTAKNFNQHARRGCSYRAWLGSGVIEPPLPNPPDPPEPPAPPQPEPTPDPPVPPMPTDSVPVVTLTAPVNGASLSGEINVTATVQGVDVTEVYLIVDGLVVGSPKTAPPYSFKLDTTKGSDGQHSLFVRAWKKDSMKPGDSAKIVVNVTNAALPPIEPPSPLPKPKPCSIKVEQASINIPRYGSGTIAVILNDLSGPTTVNVLGSDGQVTVEPLTWVSGPTSTSKQFSVRVKNKKQVRTITFQSPCGEAVVKVNVI